MAANRARWNEMARVHYGTAFYDVAGFRAGRNRLHRIEREELGDVRGKRLLHLQCHFGLDTLSWARLGAVVTGVDFAGDAIALARRLSAETGVPGDFVEANIYDLPAALDAPGAFDIVFTSYGAINWLPDLDGWAGVVAHFLKPDGVFYIVEAHPMAWLFDDRPGTADLRVHYPYFSAPEPLSDDVQGTYADPNAVLEHTREYYWPHPLGEIVTALATAGLRIEYLHEHPVVAWQMFPFMEQDADGYWRLTGPQGDIPLMFSLLARR
ncbi:MAG: class I SAM-dependent methyltransferase [Dehalococcoidia bacterium]